MSQQKRASAHTVSAYRTDLQQFEQFCATSYNCNEAREVSHEIVRAFVADLMEHNFNPKSVNRKISALKRFFKYVQAQEEMSHNPTAAIVAIKTEKRLVKTISVEAMETLFDEDHFEDDYTSQLQKTILETFYATGIRRSELINLTYNNVDIAQGQIRLTGKGNKQRVVPLTKPALQALKSYQELRKDIATKASEFFITIKGNKLYPSFVYNTVKHYLGFVTTTNKKSPHVLRHSFATHMLDQGAEINDLKELLGHANLSATQHYTHNSIEKLKSAYNQSHPREAQNK